MHITNGISSIPSYIRITEKNQLQAISHSIKRVSETKKGYKAAKPTVSFDKPPEGQQVARRNLIKSERIIRDTKVSLWVKYVHEYQCQICGETLKLSSGQRYAEAHRIRPLGKDHKGSDVVENVLCVCPNHHVLLDYGATYIDKSQLHCVEGHEINTEYINYHNSVIYKKGG